MLIPRLILFSKYFVGCGKVWEKVEVVSGRMAGTSTAQTTQILIAHSTNKVSAVMEVERL